MTDLGRKRGCPKTALSHFKPIFRAYALAYVSVTGPRLFGLLRIFNRKDLTIEEKFQLVLTILRSSTHFNRFPTSCAIIVGGATLLPRVVISLLFKLSERFRAYGIPRHELHPRLIRNICIFLSSLLAFTLLNHDDAWSRRRAQSLDLIDSHKPTDLPTNELQDPPTQPPTPLAGKTIDFTLFTTTRALSVLTLTLWQCTKSSSHHPLHTNPRLATLLTHLADPLLFATSAALIMHSWVYSPSQLPRSYNHWITKAASPLDPRLLTALRLARKGEWTYGSNSPNNNLLRDAAVSLNLPPSYGDPTISIPIKCTLVHSGTGPSCEYHALHRFARAYLFSISTYLPLQLLLRLLRRPSFASLTTSIRSAARSSAFLATFISSFYYGVCLTRTRLGPKLLPPHKPWGVTPQQWDSGLCILSGCLLCGCSILIEEPGRRGEMALFVAPRALATVVPRVYERRDLWKEGAVFGGGVVVVLDAVMTGKGERVRGVLGRVLRGVLTA